jgi:predicted amidophosphoribosyltransferase
MVGSFGINVVSRHHAVVCGRCRASAQTVDATCTQCGTDFAEGGFRIVATASQRPRRRRAIALRTAASLV